MPRKGGDGMWKRDSRLWAVVIAAAFLLLWFAGVGTAYAAPAQEPLPEPAPAVQSAGAKVIGTLGWCLVGVGFLGVALSAAFGGRPRRRNRRLRAVPMPRHPSRVLRSVYSPPPARRYRRNIERRF